MPIYQRTRNDLDVRLGTLSRLFNQACVVEDMETAQRIRGEIDVLLDERLIRDRERAS